MTITILKILAIIILILFVSYFCGRLLITDRKGKFMISCATGLISIWGIFYIVCLPMVYLRRTVADVISVFVPLIGLVTLAGIIYAMYERFFGTKKAGEGAKEKRISLTREEIAYLGIFLGVVAFQLYKIAFFAVADGDDAFYVAVAENARVADGLYTTDPYTGFATTVPYRYALAPFPILIAILARISGLGVATVAHISIPLSFVPISYAIFNAVARNLFKEKRAQRYMFMALLSIFALFGNYSINTVETFMLTRSRQGKEALAAIVIPYLFLMFFEITEGGLKKIKNVIFLFLLSLAAALCSLFGNVICEIIYFAFFIYLCINKACLREKLTLIAIAVPNACISLLYLLLR